MNIINELVKIAKLDKEILALILFGSSTRQENLNDSDVDRWRNLQILNIFTAII